MALLINAARYGMGAAWARHRRGMGAAWAGHGRGMSGAWARHGRGMGAAWARHGRGMACLIYPEVCRQKVLCVSQHLEMAPPVT
jgi:hypothetical protein